MLGLVASLFLALTASRASAQVIVPDGFTAEMVADGLTFPTAMALLPDGRILVTEQFSGSVRLVVGGAVAAHIPLTVPSLNTSGGERGLLGIAIDPGWPARPYVYLVYTRTGSRIRLARYTAIGDVSDPQGSEMTLVSRALIIDDMPDDASIHNGSCLRFGNDGNLYMTVGDDDDQCLAADSTSQRGQMLRLRVDLVPAIADSVTQVPRGLIIPADNPFEAAADSNAMLVWAYGLRNPWRFVIDPVYGSIYTVDVGSSQFEEINEVFPGDFLGWPWREGTQIRSPSCVEPGGIGANTYKPPIFAFQRPAGLTAMLVGPMYRAVPGGSNNWPAEYEGAYGSLFYAEYYAGWLRRLKKQAGVWKPAPAVQGQPNGTDWATGLDSPTDFAIAGDGSMLWLSQGGSVNRIRFGSSVSVPSPTLGGSMSAAPNPFRTRTEIQFAMAEAGAVKLEVYDVSGRRVRRLLEGAVGPGTSRVAWDGSDDGGSPLPPGVYMGRLRGPRGSESIRLLRLR
jgi:glucose/arabinose dehydrogenase